jgi:uncharacterized protein (DUF58 family)
VFVVSDFLVDRTTDPALSGAARRLGRDHDVVPIRLTDRGGDDLPDVGLLALFDPETGQRRVIDTRASVRARYRDRKETLRAEVAALFRGLRMDVVEVRTDEDYVPALIHFFRRRERRSR